MKPQALIVHALILSASTLALSACESVTTGKSGLLEFRYSSDDDNANFNKPIAVGAKLDLRVYKAGSEGNRDATIESVTSEDDAVLKVVGSQGNTFTIEATGDGSAELTVQAKLSATDASVSDAIDMMARVPEVVAVRHSCLAAAEVEGYYFKDQEIYLPFDMKLKDGQNVIGYGYYPVKFDNAAVALKAGNKLQSFIHATIGDVTGPVRLTSDLDTSTALTLNIVEPGQIDGARLDDTSGIGVNKTDLRDVLPSIGQKPICQAKAEFTVESSTPTICEVKRISDQDAEQALKALTRTYGWIEIKGLAVGDCSFNVTYPAGAGGQGVSVTLSVAIENQP